MSYLDGIIYSSKYAICQSRWLNGLKRGPKAGRLLGMRVRIRPGAWVSLSLSLLLSVVWCRVEVSATGQSLVQRIPTE